MTITTEDCKKFIIQNSDQQKHSNNKWKRIRKYKKGNLILRDFSNSDGVILTVCEDEYQNLSFYKQDKPKMHSNWLKVLTIHFSDPCYKDENYTPERMLMEFLAVCQHAMQHNDLTEDEVYFETESSVTWLVFPNSQHSENPIMIDLKELEKYGYIPKKNQSGYDFVNDHWNWY